MNNSRDELSCETCVYYFLDDSLHGDFCLKQLHQLKNHFACREYEPDPKPVNREEIIKYVSKKRKRPEM